MHISPKLLVFNRNTYKYISSTAPSIYSKMTTECTDL